MTHPRRGLLPHCSFEGWCYFHCYHHCCFDRCSNLPAILPHAQRPGQVVVPIRQCDPLLAHLHWCFVLWFGKDDISNRGRLACGCILVVISTSLVAAWAIIYFVWIYKQEYVYYGWGTPESGYLKFQKKYYIFRELLTAIIILTCFSYFICVTSRYRDLLREARDPED